jgi:hypothetical protein
VAGSVDSTTSLISEAFNETAVFCITIQLGHSNCQSVWSMILRELLRVMSFSTWSFSGQY